MDVRIYVISIQTNQISVFTNDNYIFMSSLHEKSMSTKILIKNHQAFFKNMYLMHPLIKSENIYYKHRLIQNYYRLLEFSLSYNS